MNKKSTNIFKCKTVQKGRINFNILLQNPKSNFKILGALQNPVRNYNTLRAASPPSMEYRIRRREGKGGQFKLVPYKWYLL